MARQGAAYAPYSPVTVQAYALELGQIDLTSSVKVDDIPNILSALEALHAKSLVWRAAHGEHALEEQGLVELMHSQGLLP